MKRIFLVIAIASSLIFGSCKKETVEKEIQKQQTVEEIFLSHSIASYDSLTHTYKYYDLNTKTEYKMNTDMIVDSLYRVIDLKDTLYFQFKKNIFSNKNCILYKTKILIRYENYNTSKVGIFELEKYRVIKNEQYDFIKDSILYKFKIIESKTQNIII
ncbi:MAG: hypothetical protein V4538_00845 [Bacteroidota bacterium]